MTPRTFKKWLLRVGNTTDPWTETEIVSFRMAVRRAPKEQRLQLLYRFEVTAPTGLYRITDEQSEKGRLYLLSKSLRLDGRRRAGCKLGIRELSILRSLSHHEFTGLYASGSGFHPVYTAVSTDGSYFTYTGVTYDMLEVLGVGVGDAASTGT